MHLVRSIYSILQRRVDITGHASQSDGNEAAPGEESQHNEATLDEIMRCAEEQMPEYDDEDDDGDEEETESGGDGDSSSSSPRHEDEEAAGGKKQTQGEESVSWLPLVVGPLKS